jgi:SAM-dependent methyltransferase
MVDRFANIYDAHDHSLRVLEVITGYDAFLDSLTTVADMGCGTGLDMRWWATLETRDDEPAKYNYTCYAIDRDLSKFDYENLPPNIKPIEANFENKIELEKTIDLLWCHDSFQYAVNPMQTLKNWNEMMTVNGMMIIMLPQTSGHEYNRFMHRVYNGHYFSHNICNLFYMLAVNGFDCRDSYMYKVENDPWIHLAVYKSDIPPMDPYTTTWNDLDEKGLLHKTLSNSIRSYGYLRQEDILLQWLDKQLYFVKD